MCEQCATTTGLLGADFGHVGLGHRVRQPGCGDGGLEILSGYAPAPVRVDGSSVRRARARVPGLHRVRGSVMT